MVRECSGCERRASGRAEILAQRVPIHLMPPGVEVVAMLFRKTCLIEDELSPGALAVEFEVHDRVNALVPVADSPRLHDSPTGDELDVAADNHSSEAGKRSTGSIGYLGWSSAGKCLKSAGIGKRRIHALGARLELHLLMNRRGQN